jgi:23S rRNA pseudouridine2604 synthase
MKLDKYIASTGYCSRRKALVLIEEKRVKVNGKPVSIYNTVKETDEVKIDNVLLKREKLLPVFIAYHKPKGIICTCEKITDNIIDAINHPQTIYPVGRLDKDSEGLILLTNQSLLIDQIANPKGNHEKEYLVTLNLPVRNQFLDEIMAGIKLGKEQTKPCVAKLEPGTKRVMRIILTQGLNRQIRKMCNAYQYQVIKLQRVRVMNIHLGKLKEGEWRDLTETEIKELFETLNLSLPKIEPKILKEKKVPEPQLKSKEVKVEAPIVPKQKLLSEKLKKHEIKANKKAPWKKMQTLGNKSNTEKTSKPMVAEKLKPRRKKKDNRVIKSIKRVEEGD